MESIQLDIKLVLGMAAIIAGLGGFYYTTEMRLDNLESSIQSNNCDCDGLKKQVNALRKRIKKLEKN